MSNVKLLYGRGELSVDLPETSDVTLIRKPRMPRLADPSLSVESTLSNPTASTILKNHAKNAKPSKPINTGRFEICAVVQTCLNHRILSAGKRYHFVGVI